MPILADFENHIKRISTWFSWVAIVSLALMLFVSLFDIVVGKLFIWSLPGTIDIIGLIGALVITFSIAQTHVYQRHVKVDFVLILLPKKVQIILNAFSSLFSLGLFMILIWTSVEYAFRIKASGELSQTLKLPLYPFIFSIALSCIPLCLLFICDFCKSIKELKSK
jgi:TRAP-type C4-dicarboxylate transport system permease small subunit